MKDLSFVVTPLDERLKAIISAETDSAGRFGWLQKKTGISRNTWQTWWDKAGAPPGGKMMEAAARLWPQYALWLVTGITDGEYGHNAPPTVPNSATWPEDNAIRAKNAAEYLKQAVHMQDRCAEDTRSYAASKDWDKDWEKLNALTWEREVRIHSMRVLFGQYEDRLRNPPAKINPWEPDQGEGIHPDS